MVGREYELRIGQTYARSTNCGFIKCAECRYYFPFLSSMLVMSSKAREKKEMGKIVEYVKRKLLVLTINEIKKIKRETILFCCFY